MQSNRTIQVKFTGDASGLTKTTKELEASFARLAKASGNVGGRPSAGNPLQNEVKAQKDILNLQFLRERAERSSQQARQASLAATREEIRLERERNRLASQSSGGRRQSGSADPAMARAQADIKRMQAEQGRGESQLTRQIEREAKAQATVKISEAKRANLEQIRALKQIESESGRAAKSSNSMFSQSLGGSFFGNLGANAVSFFVSKFAQLPSAISGIIGDAVKLSENKINALKGLESAADSKGIDRNTAEESVKNLRLVKAGILDITDAATGYKNLISTGFNDDKAVQILERFSDAAAFGKQSALTFGEAISRAAEGVKNQNSNLVDNVGLTKNLSVILKERGFELEDLTDKTKKQAAIEALYQGIIAETAAQVGDADKLTTGYTGSVASLEQAYKQLFTAGGDLITQSPEMIAANKIQAEQIQGLTKDLTAQGSETQKTAQQWIVMWAQIKVATFSGLSIIKNLVSAVFAALSGLVSGVFGTITAVFEGVASGIRFTLGNIVNGAIYSINQVIALTKKLPAGLGGLLQGVNPIETRANTETNFDYSKKFFSGVAEAQKVVDRSITSGAASMKEMSNDFTKLEQYSKKIREEARSAKTNPAKKGEAKSDNDAGGLSGGKAKKGKKGIDYLDYKELSSFARQMGFDVTSTTGGKHNKGSLHGKGLAIDIRTNNKTAAQIEWLMSEAKKSGINVKDERVRPAGQKVWGGAHLHLSDARLKKGVNRDTTPFADFNEDYAEKARRALEDQSNQITKAEKDKIINTAIGAFKIAGLIPTGETLTEFQSAMVEEAKKAGIAQPSKEAVSAIFEANRQKRVDARGLITSNATVSNDISALPTLDDQYISNLRESLGLTKGRNDEESRYYNLIMRGRNAMDEVSARLEDQSLSRREATVEAEIEYQILLRRNSAEEIALSFIQSRNEQTRELGDTENAIVLLRRQNSDDQFADQRRLLSAKREQLSLEQNITDLQDRLSNGDANKTLEIQAAHLQNILDLRQRELDAVISINRSQLELSQALVVSNDQIKAKVLEHLASQKNINEAYADGIIGVYDKVAGKLDSIIDKGTKKLGFLGSLVAEPLKAIGRNALSNITGGLLDKFFPGVGGGIEKTGNPVVDKVSESNTYLKSIDSKLGGFSLPRVGGGSGSSSSGGIGGIIKNLFGGGGQNSGSSSGGGSSLNGGAFTGFGSPIGAGGAQGLIFGGSAGGSSSSGGGGSIISNLKGLFSSKDGGLFGKGGIFGKEGFGKNVGTFSAVGSGAALLGGLISSKFGGSAVGRRLGGALSGAGSGLALGAQIGSIVPGIGTVIGAGLGALIGGIAGLIGSGGLRKKEEKLRAESLRSAVSGLSGIDQIIEDVRALRTSPESGLASATALGSQLRAQYLEQANALKDKKTKRIALASVSELDFKIRSKMDALRAVSDISQAAIERKNRILPEFASGGFMDRAFISQFKDFKRRNGMLSGRFDGRDTLPSMLAPGEMVLNPNQQERTKRAAGFDVFRHAEIPNYATGTFVAPVVSTPTFSVPAANQVGATVVIENLAINVDSLIGTQDATKIYAAGAQTESGQRVMVKNIKIAQRNKEI
ncbi:MAG TPA: hypothetical protein VNI84_08700 [Pyrinomonadaceae bacterium]|nr:hypothetical protein [Pyrinomonadaceae bacterium]